LGGRPLDPAIYRPEWTGGLFKRRRAPTFIEAVDKAIALARERRPLSNGAEGIPVSVDLRHWWRAV
jgi:hypothetical protein